MAYLDEEPLTCLDDFSGETCSKDVEYRLRPSDWKTFPRCSKHYGPYLQSQEEISRRYPYHQPADFDPMDAGEVWGKTITEMHEAIVATLEALADEIDNAAASCRNLPRFLQRYRAFYAADEIIAMAPQLTDIAQRVRNIIER